MSDKHDQLGDRMKDYERIETARKFHPAMPIYARIDGKGFSKFTQGLVRPFDSVMSRSMIETTKFLVKETHAAVGYTQSDEISLFWNKCSDVSAFLFDGKSHKLHSVLASLAAAKFGRETQHWTKPWCDKFPAFDARVFQVPFDFEITNLFLWRANDATKNSVSMACRAEFSPKQMHLKNQDEMIQMLAEKGIDYHQYPAFFKHGTFVKRRVVEQDGIMRSEIAEYSYDARFSSFPHAQRHAFLFGEVEELS